MKLDQLQQAQNLYFQTDLSKTDIAQLLDINRRTLHYWIKHYNWDRLKKSAEYIPSFIAENCYHVMGHYTESLLSPERYDKPITPQEINALNKLGLTINRLKNRGTLNENIEMFKWFSESVETEDAELAGKIRPYIDKYIFAKAKPNHRQHLPVKMDEQGYIKQTPPSTEEEQKDFEDMLAWAEQHEPGSTDAYKATQEKKHALLEKLLETLPSEEHETPTPAAARTETSEVSVSTERKQQAFAPQKKSEPVVKNIEPSDKSMAALRKAFRGTATSGPGKAWKQKQAALAA